MEKFEQFAELIAKAEQGDMFINLFDIRKDANAAYDRGELVEYQWRILDRRLKAFGL